MKKRTPELCQNSRIQDIKSSVIPQLKDKGFAEFESNQADTAILIQKLIQTLFVQEKTNSLLLIGANFYTYLPKIRFDNHKMLVECNVLMSGFPRNKVIFTFKYSLKNSAEQGVLIPEEIKINYKIKSGNEKALKTIIASFNIGAKTKNILTNLNQEIKRIIGENHGEPNCIKSVSLKINNSSISITLN